MEKGWHVFIDETGLFFNPLVRTTWAPRGHPPAIEPVMGWRRKVSAIAALCVSGDGRRVRLYLQLFPDDSIDAQLVEAFLGDLMRHLRGRVALVWDRLEAHKSSEVEDFTDAHPRLRSWFFPTYCPELNPVEQLWRWLKWDKMANFAPKNMEELMAKAEDLGGKACSSRKLLRSFIEHSELPLRLHEGRALVS